MRDEIVELEIDVSELRLGMHVIRLDCVWEDTAFLFQGFIIQSRDEIDALQIQCRKVVIEGKVKRELDKIPQGPLDRPNTAYFQRFSTDSGNTGTTKKSGKKSHSNAQRSARRATYINKVDVNTEIRTVTRHYAEAKSVAAGIMAGLRVGRTLDINRAREVVNNCVDSILRNNDALLLLTKLKQKDNYTAEHSLNVSILSAAFGKRLGLLEEEIRTLGLCGLLHDIGKTKVPLEILQKSGGLTPQEYCIMQNHANWGRDMLMALPKVVHATIDVAYNHHERLDGRGYPRGLVDHQIPYNAKIVAIADTYDAITSNRAYDSARSSMSALKTIHRFRGTQFDSELAREFILMIGIYPPGSIVELKTGEIAIVLTSNPKNRRKPRIMLVRTADKKRIPKYATLDLDLHPKADSGELFTISKELPDGTFDVFIQHFIENGLVLNY
ncbi:MAG: HD-GYP domain-containing protein (c-di-GMP phosphodiesterase class II) [Marinobacter psychrophilus]|jgi:HD-GYP domain-containing protein (c-di-GMP phosphodiesterase class II)